MKKWLIETIDKSPTLGAMAVLLLTVSTTMGAIQTLLIAAQVLDSIIIYFTNK